MTVTQILVKTEEAVMMELTATLVCAIMDMKEIIAKSVKFCITSEFLKYELYSILANIYRGLITPLILIDFNYIAS